jgi:hypothetical protein
LQSWAAMGASSETEPRPEPDLCLGPPGDDAEAEPRNGPASKVPRDAAPGFVPGFEPGLGPDPRAEVSLEKAVEPYRPWYRRERRAAARLIGMSVATILASAALFSWTMSPTSPVPVVVEPAPAAIAIAKAPPAPEPAVDGVPAGELPTALLAADDPIGPTVGRIPAREDAPLRGVAAAADEFGVIAVWTDRVVWVSRDDGRSFRQELAAPEPLGAVAVGPDARVYAARLGGRLGILSPGGSASWVELGCDQVLAIDASAEWLAVLALHTDRSDGLSPIVWLSSDHGSTWRRLVAPTHGDTLNQIRVSTDGVIDLLALDSVLAAGGAASLRHYTGHVDGRPFELSSSGDDPQPFGLDHDGRSWRLAGNDTQMRLTATGLPTVDAASSLRVRSWDIRLAANREHTVASADGQMVELGAGPPRTVARRVPGPIDSLALDGIGRIVATVGGKAVRYSTRHGWRSLFEIPAP